MNLRFVVNWVGDFLKQLHANMAEHPLAIVEDPAAPRAGAGAKTLLHPRCASAHKSRFDFGHRFGFGTKSIAHLGQGTAIA